MKSIEKLRRVANEWCTSVVSELVSVYTGDYVRSESVSDVQVANALRNAIKEIEQEFKELDDGELAEMGLMRLPLDANGVPVRVGDVMECFGSWEGVSPFEVRAMWLDEGGWELYDRLGDRCRPSVTSHHREPTVEDVLRELMAEVSGPCYAEDVLLEKYAPRLRLAEEE